ncbi:hypothetical protein CHS0354_028769 [Potamilus streckersoni]|uniref:TIR domain-containing protein n=1 Tax=Potamilus streckersoni TaxID=2493646 RepID=A0AAE0S8I6_9BIVA|nr:hypothetical protein CHS0354_028769 [Potamilus streckersoni]
MLAIIGIFIICNYRRYFKLRHIKLLIEKYRKGDPPNKHLVCHSFCTNDRDFVYRYIQDELKDALSERLGASKDDIVCICDVHLEPGRYILDDIVRCTESSSIVLLVVSEAFFRSHYCDFEVLCAELEKKPIILMILEELDPKLMSKMIYKHFQRYTRTERFGQLNVIRKYYVSSMLSLHETSYQDLSTKCRATFDKNDISMCSFYSIFT